MRKNLSKGLGFSKEDRSTNVRRIGFVASQVVRHGGIAVVANIAPYLEDRKHNQQVISNEGNMVQIWVDTPISKCEERDVKGLYKLAREGKIKEFTGISDPFETPNESDLIIDGTKDINSLVSEVLQFIKDKNYIWVLNKINLFSFLMINKVIIEKLVDLVKIYHQEILKIYNSDDFNIEIKSDNSPLTKADKVTNDIIYQD